MPRQAVWYSKIDQNKQNRWFFETYCCIHCLQYSNTSGHAVSKASADQKPLCQTIQWWLTFILLSAIELRSCFGMYTRPTLPSKLSKETFFSCKSFACVISHLLDIKTTHQQYSQTHAVIKLRVGWQAILIAAANPQMQYTVGATSRV